ncbi:MAG: hypothetical protein HY866_10485 [Chloroflexi bacterium]|nr:hypothetical protein [Chloroflexota bacterium]
MFSQRRYLTLLILVLFVFAAVPVSAQGGGNIPVPSTSGGHSGSPGMGGSASFTMPTVPQGSMPQGSPPSFTPPSTTPPTFDTSERTRPSFTPPEGGGSGFQGGTGERPQPGGERPRPGSDQEGQGGENLQAWGSGFSPFSQDSSGQYSRFGERGSGSIELGQLQAEGTLGWFDSGGFGALTEPPQDGIPASSGPLSGDWHPQDSELPQAPGAFEDISTVTEAQAQAQQAISDAGQNRDEITDQAQQNIQQAADQAQATYDQFWTDYYAAVETTAQAYYDTVTATADYLLQSYTAAVNYTVAVVDYYLAYYDQYATYCYYYPWDCYSYAYDIATGAYYYVGDTSDQPVAYVEIGEVAVTTGYPAANTTPVPSAEAYQAVTVFANDQLGAVVEPLYAGEATDQVQIAVQALPDELEAFVLKAIPASCGDYWGLINGGVAGVLVGDCSTAARTLNTAALSAELSVSSLGAYGLYANAALPGDPTGALDLITKVYPALEGLAFAQITDVSAGLAFTATAAGLGIDPVTGQSLSVAKVVYAGVAQVNGQTFVYAVVGVGQPYVDLIASGQ